MVVEQFRPPSNSELEVSIFGPGYGESVLIHLGTGKWVLVDSCLDPDSQPAALVYLNRLEIDPAEAVQLIVATHWHDDHIRGISTTFHQCSAADFAAPAILNTEEFFTLLASHGVSSTLKSSGIDEFSKILEILKTRKLSHDRLSPAKWAVADRVLYCDDIELDSSSVEARVSALSPSDASLLQAQLSFANLLEEQKQRRDRITSPSPNHGSIVLWVEVGEHKILLGSDLEVTSCNNTGWSAILESSSVVNGKAEVFKIPHHGSENAHHPQVWIELLIEEPFSMLSSFRRGNIELPTFEDIDRISSLTSKAYITSSKRQRRIKFRDKVVRKTLKEVNCQIRDIHHGWGQVRVRRRIADENAWRVEVFGDACSLADAVKI